MTAKELIKKHEGLSLTVYKCPAGHNTIGYGHNIDVIPLPGGMKSPITEEQSEVLLDADIAIAIAACKRVFIHFDELSDNRQAALIDFVFNVGEGTAKKFKKVACALFLQDYNGAADELKNSDWYRQVGNRGKEIVQIMREG